MNAENIKNTIEEFCPPCLAEEWDNSGMQIEIPDKVVKKVLVALEVSELVIDQARALGIDMIVTHHPLFFAGFKSITADMLPTRYAMELIKLGISVYSAHTNFDKMPEGNNEYFGKLLGIKNIQSSGFVWCGDVDRSTVSAFADDISIALKIKKAKMRLVGNPNDVVKKVAWCTGAGADFMMEAKDTRADLYVTGDLKYHDAMTASELEINILDIGHFGSEKIFVPNMAEHLRGRLSGVEVFESNMDIDPFTLL